MIVIVLENGPRRFTDIRQHVEGVSPKVLASTLRDLERDGIVSRTSYPQMPPRVEYALTPLGETLFEPLRALARWAETNTAKILANRKHYDLIQERTTASG